MNIDTHTKVAISEWQQLKIYEAKIFIKIQRINWVCAFWSNAKDENLHGYLGTEIQNQETKMEMNEEKNVCTPPRAQQ